MNNKEIEPKEYFDKLEKKLQKITDDELINFYDGCLALVEKYKATGQRRVIQKMRFLIDCVEKERKAVELGVDSFVYRNDIEDYIDNVSHNVVKIIELENYPREIPDYIVNIIKICKEENVFDQYYVLFTDYTGEEEKRVAKNRREKDPILFGTLQKSVGNNEILLNDRFYFLGDWVDEYCDLTMDRFLKEAGQNKLKYIGTPQNKDQIRQELNRLDDNFRITEPPKRGFKEKLRRLFKRR